MDEKCIFFFIFMKKVQTCPMIWDNMLLILHPETKILIIKNIYRHEDLHRNQPTHNHQ